MARHNQLTAGAAFDRGTVDFTQNTQFGYLNPDRTITGVNAWQDGSTNGNGTPVDSRVNLHGATPNWSLFATDTLSLGKAWNVTLSGRYNRSTIDNTDRINPIAGPGSLNGDYVFGRFNPSIGVTYNPTLRSECLRELLARQPRADIHRTRLRRSEQPLQSAERAGQRSAAQSGGHDDLGGRPARQSREQT